jgi:conjugative relaxase-like TrwC/TraI family protein
MLSIGKLAKGQEGYYLDAVARGVEDYYLEGEAPGRWLAAGTSLLGLEGEVDADALAAVLDGRDPTSGIPLRSSQGGRVPGFDLTFRAPKSVSVVFGLAEAEIAAVVAEAHDLAVDAALGYLERYATWTRRGHGGIQQIRGDGLVAAAFRHRTSRAGDPHLHTHVLVANTVRGTDGRWSTIDARHFYWHSKTAGYLYEAHLRSELTARLGVRWTKAIEGIADIEGVPLDVLGAFSTRRAEIEERLAIGGWSSPRAAEIAALTTRKVKKHDVDPTTLRSRWRDQAREMGFGPQQLAAVMDQQPVDQRDLADVRAIEAALLSPTGLTRQSSSFDRRNVLNGVAERRRNGASVAHIKAIADRLLCHADVVPLAGKTNDVIRTDSGRVISRASTGARWTTRELLALEQRTVDRALARRGTGVGLVDAQSLAEAVLALPDDQGAVVEHLGSSGHGVDVLTAPAGSGKTYTLKTARQVWEASGYRVIGAALAARAAAELQSAAGIPSSTLTRLLGRLDRSSVQPNTVLVIDEAEMVGTRMLARLLDHAERAGAKVVLVGDPRQLPEIDAGGLLASLAERLPGAELTTNRRQREPWEQQALRQLRDGDVDHALAAYHRHDRITALDSYDEAVDTIVGRWVTARTDGEDAVMLASRNQDVANLNRAARAVIAATGHLDGPELSVRGLTYQRGDEVMTLRNNARLGVRNGTRGMIDSVDPNERTMTVAFSTGERAILPPDYLDSGFLTYAYASTVHKAQGRTCDRAFLLATDDLYQELGYVALSRGRLGNHIVTVGGLEHDLESPPHAPTIERDSLDLLRSGLSTSRAQQLAIDLDRAAHFSSMPTAELVHGRRRLAEMIGRAPADRTADLPELIAARDSAEQRLRQLQHEHSRVHLLGRSRGQSRAERERVIDRVAADVAEHATAITRAEESTTVRSRHLVEHATDIADLRHIDDVIVRHVEETVIEAEDDSDHYLRRAVGAPPVGSRRREVWRERARAVERYRMTYAITDQDRPLGLKPRDTQQLIAYRGVVQEAKVIQPEPAVKHARRIGRGVA